MLNNDWHYITNNILKTAPTAATRATLDRITQILTEDNPNLTFVADDNAVWLRDYKRGKDFGIYAATIDGKVMLCMNQDNQTPLHRNIPWGWTCKRCGGSGTFDPDDPIDMCPDCASSYEWRTHNPCT